MAEIVEIDSYRDSDGDTHYNVYVTYEYKDALYEEVSLGFYSSSMYEGKEISVLCDPNNPGRIEEDTAVSIAGVVMLFMGAIFFLVGFVPIISGIIKAGKAKKLLSTGQVLYATVDMVDVNRSYRVNGRHPYVIYCTYKDPYQDVIYRFKSDNLWSDPGYAYQPGSTIKVLVNPKKYSEYYVQAEESMTQRIEDYT